MGLKAIAKDYPPAATVAAGVLVALHAFAASRWSLVPNASHAMGASPNAWQIYLGFAGVVAISAGFAGVILVFALEQSDDRFRRLRRLGGTRLMANWFSPVRVSLVAAFASVGCAVAASIGHGIIAWWVFEYVLVWSALSAGRLFWLLRILTRVVAAVDSDVGTAGQRAGDFDLAAHLERRQRDAG